ncbi:MAG: DUF1573 domain-containing protein [Pirellulaceae bacterium]|nr:DUF1573 domain-containing protein [Pirellulaceae bacterium]
MKNFFLALIPLALLCVGVFGLSRAVRFKPWTKPGQEAEYKELLRIISIPMADPNASKLPRAECSEQEHDFGVMEPFVDGSCKFTITNSGSDQLVLKNGKESCTCLDSDLSAATLQPGEAKEIEVTWNTDKAGDFAQFVRVLTNSPSTPELDLWVRGKVGVALGGSIASFEFSGVESSEPRSQNFFLFSDLLDSFSIDRIEYSTDGLQCAEIERPAEKPSPMYLRQRPPANHRSRIDLRLDIGSQLLGERSEYVRIFVRPAKNVAESGGAEWSQAVSSQVRTDGTILVQLPVRTRGSRRLSLYGPAIADGENMIVDLGKLRVSAGSRDWSIIAKIRGDLRPTEMKVALTGIPGVSAIVEPIENTPGQTGINYRIKIHAEEKLRMGVYNREQAGKLVIEAPGLPGEERLEFTVELDVLEDS